MWRAPTRTSIRISAALVVVALAPPRSVTAQPGSPAGDQDAASGEREPDWALDDVVVRAAPASQRGLEAGAFEAGAHSAAMALSRSASAVALVSGSRGEQTLLVNGFDQRQLRVTLDGVPIALPYDGQLDLQPLPAALLERADVQVGADDVLYGIGGLGGGVNLVLRRPERAALAQLSVHLDQAGGQQYVLSHGQDLGAAAYLLLGQLSTRPGTPLPAGLGASQVGGLRSNSDSLNGSLGLKTRLTWDAQRLELGALHQQGRWGVPPHIDALAPRFLRFTDWRASTLYLGHRLRSGAWLVEERASLGLFSNTLDSYDDASYRTQLGGNAFSSRYDDLGVGLTVRAERALALAALRLRAGALAELRYEQHQRQDLIATATSDPGERRSSQLLWSLGPRGEARLLALPLAGSLGLQLDGAAPLTGPAELRPQDTMLGLGPRLGLRAWPSPAVGLRLGAAMRDRFPTLKERYSSALGLRLPSPDLRPERAMHLTAGLDLGPWRPGEAGRWQLRLGLTGFDAEVRDLIELAALGDGQTQLVNLAAARLAGAEATLDARWAWLTLRSTATWLYAVALPAAGGAATALPDRPSLRWLSGLQARPWPWLESRLDLELRGPTSVLDSDSGRRGELGAFALAHVTLTVRPLDWLAVLPAELLTLRLGVENLGDVVYYWSYGFPAPGRRLWLELAVGWPGTEQAPPGPAARQPGSVALDRGLASAMGLRQEGAR